LVGSFAVAGNKDDKVGMFTAKLLLTRDHSETVSMRRAGDPCSHVGRRNPMVVCIPDANPFSALGL
jgi:hypothetical protein